MFVTTDTNSQVSTDPQAGVAWETESPSTLSCGQGFVQQIASGLCNRLQVEAVSAAGNTLQVVQKCYAAVMLLLYFSSLNVAMQSGDGTLQFLQLK